MSRTRFAKRWQASLQCVNSSPECTVRSTADKNSFVRALLEVVIPFAPWCTVKAAVIAGIAVFADFAASQKHPRKAMRSSQKLLRSSQELLTPQLQSLRSSRSAKCVKKHSPLRLAILRRQLQDRCGFKLLVVLVHEHLFATIPDCVFPIQFTWR